jgi:predicted GNAT superfamily acetyltransferase/nitrite reductase/ring-hydroxylating ferredoxin subunit
VNRVDLGPASAFPEGALHPVEVGGLCLLVHRAGQRVSVLENACPHRGRALSDGKVDADRCAVTCAGHGWRIDLRSGAVTFPRVGQRVRQLPAEVKDGRVLVEAPAELVAADEPIEVRQIADADGIKRCQDLLIEIWDLERGGQRNIIPTRLFKITAGYGGSLIGAFTRAQELVGFAWALPAIDEDGLFLFSDTLGVRPRYRDQGVGRALKLAQRRWALDHGMTVVRWTFDPLESRNACLNLGVLGAQARSYLCNMYGAGLTGPNKGLETDRLLVDWRLDADHVARRNFAELRATPPPDLPSCIEVEEAGGELRPRALKLDHDSDAVLVPVPPDLQRLKERDLELARGWRQAVRRVFELYFAQGYVATDFHLTERHEGRHGFYRLERGRAERRSIHPPPRHPGAGQDEAGRAARERAGA